VGRLRKDADRTEFVVPPLEANGMDASNKIRHSVHWRQATVLNVIRAARKARHQCEACLENQRGDGKTVHAKRSKFLELITETAQE